MVSSTGVFVVDRTSFLFFLWIPQTFPKQSTTYLQHPVCDDMTISLFHGLEVRGRTTTKRVPPGWRGTEPRSDPRPEQNRSSYTIFLQTRVLESGTSKVEGEPHIWVDWIIISSVSPLGPRFVGGRGYRFTSISPITVFLCNPLPLVTFTSHPSS